MGGGCRPRWAVSLGQGLRVAARGASAGHTARPGRRDYSRARTRSGANPGSGGDRIDQLAKRAGHAHQARARGPCDPGQELVDAGQTFRNDPGAPGPSRTPGRRPAPIVTSVLDGSPIAMGPGRGRAVVPLSAIYLWAGP